jgi:uracil-xanthine permease
MENNKVIQVNEKVPIGQLIPLSLQHMFAMFGASVLVPILFGINPAAVLLMNGVGTLFFIFVTKGKAPAYLGSSFAFLGPALYIIANYGGGLEGFSYAQGGFVVVGIGGCILAGIIYKFGSDWIHVVLPPAAMGPVVALIGLTLAGTAAEMAGLKGAQGAEFVIEPTNLIIFVVTLGIAAFGSVLFRKFLAVIPILIAVVAGYITAAFCGVLDFTAVEQAKWFSIPQFQMAKFDITAILIMLPVLLVIVTEHIGHQVVASKVVGADLVKEPGLHRSLFADNFSTAVSGLIGAVPTTTYSENLGVMAVTKVYSVYVIAGAAILSITFSFVGKISALIMTMPGPVIGGISFLLYGMIGANGIRLLVDAKVDYGKSRNLVLTSIIFVTGLSGVKISLGNVELEGMVLAAMVGMVLSLCFAVLDKLKLTNDQQA